MQSAVSRWGNSLAVRLPRSVAEDAGLADGAPVDIRVEDGRVVIAPTRPSVRLDDLLGRFRPEHRHGEADWGADRGAERF